MINPNLLHWGKCEISMRFAPDMDRMRSYILIFNKKYGTNSFYDSLTRFLAQKLVINPEPTGH